MKFSLKKQTVHTGIGTGPAVGMSFDRRHDLDALRAGTMLLGIGLHAALAYMTVRIWPVYDDRHHAFFDTLFSAVHGFRMPLFFMVSGFFTAMLWRKRGLAALVKHRAKRIFLPPVVFLAPVQLSLFGVLGFALSNNVSKSVQGQTNADLWSAAKNNDTEALTRYLRNRALIDEPDPESRLPALNWAALNGSTEAARMLIEAGADVNVRTDDGTTPLGHAAFMGNADIVALLISYHLMIRYTWIGTLLNGKRERPQSAAILTEAIERPMTARGT